ncbi:SHC-transforming protein 4 [Bufo gargarizans]|uniref:SHC-transforming protein 4 n=1 Tax=Bufo gargarizans TaxID=30331 RepID=UPI001CF2A23F|nr:SHC-transforming protein 4 [Bufo gargarizans]
MKDPSQPSGHILHQFLCRYPVMLQRAKYSRFKNDSVTTTEECSPNPSSNAKACANSHANATSFLPVEDLTLVSQDSTTTLCTFIPKMPHFKLSSSASLMRLRQFSLGTKQVPRLKLTDSHTAPNSPTSAENTFNSYMSSSQVRQDVDFSANPPEDCALPENEKSSPDQKNSYIQHVTMGPILSYCVKYMGCIEVLQSMRSLDFGTRTQVTREAISRLCEAVPCAKGAAKKRRPPVKFLSSILGKSNLQFSGINIKLTISTNSLMLTNIDTQQVVANHHMQSISFASGGDPETTDYVAYVAKDPVNQRACHILECPNSQAQEVINTIGQAFELRFKQFLKSPSFIEESEALGNNNVAEKTERKEGHEYYNEVPGKEPPSGGILDNRMQVEIAGSRSDGDKKDPKVGCPKSTNIYENCIKNPKTVGFTAHSEQMQDMLSGRDIMDDPCYMNTVSKTENQDKISVSGRSCVKSIIQDAEDLCQANKTSISSSMQKEVWYHGKMNRKLAESLLNHDGDFLVRESTTSVGQYVLSGLHGGHPKHLLLVDPEGKVRTKDRVFDNVGHLIKYHMENELPITSSGSELSLRQPVRRQEVDVLQE